MPLKPYGLTFTIYFPSIKEEDLTQTVKNRAVDFIERINEYLKQKMGVGVIFTEWRGMCIFADDNSVGIDGEFITEDYSKKTADITLKKALEYTKELAAIKILKKEYDGTNVLDANRIFLTYGKKR